MPKGGQPVPRGWMDRYFKTLRETQLSTEACKVAGVSKSYLSKQRKPGVNPQFVEREIDEKERNIEILEALAVKRAAEGSDVLMIFLLKSMRPKIYRDNVHHEHDHKVGGQITLSLDGQQPIEVDSAKRRELAAALIEDDDVIEGTVSEEKEEAA